MQELIIVGSALVTGFVGLVAVGTFLLKLSWPIVSDWWYVKRPQSRETRRNKRKAGRLLKYAKDTQPRADEKESEFQRRVFHVVPQGTQGCPICGANSFGIQLDMEHSQEELIEMAEKKHSNRGRWTGLDPCPRCLTCVADGKPIPGLLGGRRRRNRR